MNWMYEKLKSHIGHNIVCVAYGDINSPVDICIECENCNEILISAEDFEEGDSMENNKYVQTYITLDEEELRLLNIPEEYWEDLDAVNDAIHSMIYERKEN